MKSIITERDALVEEQLRGIRETLVRLETTLTVVSLNLDSVRIAELASVRAEIAKHDAELKLLRYQMGRTTAVWSLISGGVASAIVASVMAFVLR